MLQKFSRNAALLLLPVLVQAFVLPSDIVDVESNSGVSRYTFDSPTYGGPSTFFHYDIDDNSIKFSIPCPECSDEEKEALKRKIISVKPTAQTTKHCTSTDPIGLKIDDIQVESTGESSLALQSHVGPLNLTDLSKHHIFNRTRWINHCGCTRKHLDDEECDGEFESSFSLEILGLASGQIPGFTVSYRQDGVPELLRFSTFPDIGIADSWRFGQSAHYDSPLLRLQKDIKPTSTAFLVSSSFSLSSTTTAYAPSYTHFEKTPAKSGETSSPSPPVPSEAGVSSQSSISDGKTVETPSLGHSDHREHQWCRIHEVLVVVGHELEALGMKTKSRAQMVLGKVDNALHKATTSTSLVMNSKDRHTSVEDVKISHDELDVSGVDEDDADEDDDIDEEYKTAQENHQATHTGLAPAETSPYAFMDAPTPAAFWNDQTAVKAFQVTSLVFIIAALSGSLFALARRNPRLRAKWATVLEEKRNQRLYRYAAKKHRVRNFFSRFTSSHCNEKDVASSSYEECEDALSWQQWEKKQSGREVPHYPHNIDGEILKRDLLAFRKAHQFVDGVIAAEEGRQSHSRRGRHDGLAYRTRHERTWSFGSEKTAPPAYESEGEDLILDADVPRFVSMRRAMAGSRVSPDSSVVSTSPRSSCVDSDSEHDEEKF